jgi:hypothetical protein
MVAVRLVGSMDFRPDEKPINHIRDTSVASVGGPDANSFVLVELLLGEFSIRPAFRQADFLPVQRDHPPTRVPAKPDLVRACHEAPPVKKPWKEPGLDRKVGCCLPPPCRSGGSVFGTEFSTGVCAVFLSPYCIKCILQGSNLQPAVP